MQKYRYMDYMTRFPNNYIISFSIDGGPFTEIWSNGCKFKLICNICRVWAKDKGIESGAVIYRVWEPRAWNGFIKKGNFSL